MIEIVRAGAERIDDVGPLWASLAEHHGEVGAHLGRIRAPDDTWPRRRKFYEGLLAKRRAFFLIAERDDRPVGYAMVSRSQPSQTWQIEQTAVLDTLAVLPGERGGGIGSALLDRAREQLRRDGVTHLGISVLAVNEDAIRFYRRHGFEVAFLEMLGRP